MREGGRKGEGGREVGKGGRKESVSERRGGRECGRGGVVGEDQREEGE